MKIGFGFLTRHREARAATILIGFGVCLMPFLIYFIGQWTLGPSETGLAGFLKTLYGSFLTLEPSAWALLLGPYLLYAMMRLVRFSLRRNGRS
jgi:hypothetical protein